MPGGLPDRGVILTNNTFGNDFEIKHELRTNIKEKCLLVSDNDF